MLFDCLSSKCLTVISVYVIVVSTVLLYCKRKFAVKTSHGHAQNEYYILFLFFFFIILITFGLMTFVNCIVEIDLVTISETEF